MPRHAERKAVARKVKRITGLSYAAANRAVTQSRLSLPTDVPHRGYLEAVRKACEDIGLTTYIAFAATVSEMPMGVLPMEGIVNPLASVHGFLDLELRWTMHESIGWEMRGVSLYHDGILTWAIGGTDIIPAPCRVADDARAVVTGNRIPCLPLETYRRRPLEQTQLISCLKAFGAESASTSGAGGCEGAYRGEGSIPGKSEA